jgi:hypothetical protein
MPDQKGNLYLFEAIELRNEYDRHIKLLESLVEGEASKRDSYFRDNREEKKEPVAEFDVKVLAEKLKKIQTKRVKLNQAIQVANFECQVDFGGEKITLAESLEIRKNLLADLQALSQRVLNSAYKQIIHKEERDIVHEPKQSFKKSYEEYQNSLSKFRHLINQIHVANHENVVKFKDE